MKKKSINEKWKEEKKTFPPQKKKKTTEENQKKIKNFQMIIFHYP